MSAATYSRPWPVAPGKYRVATYRGNFERSPIVYHPADRFDHRTLRAACLRVATLIARRKADCPRYDAIYIITPEGERLPFNAARSRLNG